MGNVNVNSLNQNLTPLMYSVIFDRNSSAFFDLIDKHKKKHPKNPIDYNVRAYGICNTILMRACLENNITILEYLINGVYRGQVLAQRPNVDIAIKDDSGYDALDYCHTIEAFKIVWGASKKDRNLITTKYFGRVNYVWRSMITPTDIKPNLDIIKYLLKEDNFRKYPDRLSVITTLLNYSFNSKAFGEWSPLECVEEFVEKNYDIEKENPMTVFSLLVTLHKYSLKDIYNLCLMRINVREDKEHILYMFESVKKS